MDSIGERIKYLRKEHLKKTQKDFGSEIGLKPNSVSDIESGKNNPTEQTLKAIQREFNVNDEWLRNGTGKIEKVMDTEYERITTLIGVTDPRAKQAIIDYYHLTDRDKQLWWNWVERFLKGAED